MRSAMVRTILAAAVICSTAAVVLGQTTATSTETKAFEVIAVDGSHLTVRLPEGTREIAVPAGFMFTVNGQQLSVSDLRPGMKGTANITTRTTVTPVTVTEVKNGTVAVQTGMSIIVRTDEGIKSFTQEDVDKRGVRIVRNGKVAQISDFRQGDQLSATIITSLAPKVVTEKEVQATLASAGGAAGSRSAAAGSGSAPASRTASASASGGASGGGARTLPKTASSWPLLGLASALSLAMGLALTLRRRSAI
jgi:hypothetical protein